MEDHAKSWFQTPNGEEQLLSMFISLKWDWVYEKWYINMIYESMPTRKKSEVSLGKFLIAQRMKIVLGGGKSHLISKSH